VRVPLLALIKVISLEAAVPIL